ncbi:SinR family protein [Campylobacter californiensis]|uniref:SinR family protein n=1 Tax=Campylobacter mucosalis CCUG 21559 TaxID=1032067 RepID=A0A6G5QGD7_9BACT|nr:SinR family protein [Campylobacter sp. RM12916]MBE3610514.1 SinR family protein [Campylobacter sp. RM12916]QCD44684.1 hypothetical protein CMUC_0895 [Campylobacter mucosalis CCUG 21559]
MNTLIISYDLNKQGQNYNELHEAIKRLGSWWHCLDSTWLIKTNYSSVQVRDYLKTYMDANDTLLVVAYGSGAAWSGFGKECSDWLKANL